MMVNKLLERGLDSKSWRRLIWWLSTALEIPWACDAEIPKKNLEASRSHESAIKYSLLNHPGFSLKAPWTVTSPKPRPLRVNELEREIYPDRWGSPRKWVEWSKLQAAWGILGPPAGWRRILTHTHGHLACLGYVAYWVIPPICW